MHPMHHSRSGCPFLLPLVPPAACEALRRRQVPQGATSAQLVGCRLSPAPTSPCVQVISRSNVAMAVAQECVRLKPPAKLIFRRATTDTHLAGYHVPAGTAVCCYIAEVRSAFPRPCMQRPDTLHASVLTRPGDPAALLLGRGGATSHCADSGASSLRAVNLCAAPRKA